VYTLALQEGYKWSDVFLVGPINIDGYRPRDLQEDYLTETTLLRAFYRSINTPAIELGLKLGLDRFMALAKEMGVRAPLKREVGTVIGSSAVSLLDMASLYGVIASGGKSLNPQLIEKITDNLGKVLWQAPSEKPKQVIDEKIAGLMLEGLRSVLKYGTASRSSHLAPFAVGKSGTSDQSIDNWFCGFSQDLVLITWVGSEDHSPAYGDISGSETALPIWTAVMDAYFKQFPPSSFAGTAGLESRQIDPLLGFEVDKGGALAWFLNGQLPIRQNHLKEMSYLRSGGGRFRHVYSH
jgi:penicillin-binding protein 1A